MEKLKDLRDLLQHEIEDLYSAEEQILEALPAMAEKAKDKMLKKALNEHLKVTEEQKNRLDKIKELLKSGESEDGEEGGSKRKGFLAGLFGDKPKVCKGMQGLIEEGKKIMDEEMDADVKDAAIIAAAQKIEHYEICGYGTLRAFAEELKLNEVATLLETTLNEEYDADDLLTELAVGRLNQEAEGSRRHRGKRSQASSGKNSGASAISKKSASKKSASVKAAPKKASAKPVKKSAPVKKGNKKSAPKAIPEKAASKSATASKKSSPKKSTASNSKKNAPAKKTSKKR